MKSLVWNDKHRLHVCQHQPIHYTAIRRAVARPPRQVSPARMEIRSGQNFNWKNIFLLLNLRNFQKLVLLPSYREPIYDTSFVSFTYGLEPRAWRRGEGISLYCCQLLCYVYKGLNMPPLVLEWDREIMQTMRGPSTVSGAFYHQPIWG